MRYLVLMCLMVINCTAFALNDKQTSQLNKGYKYLLSQQHKDGYWGDFGGSVAITALAVKALILSPNKALYAKEIDLGLKFIAKHSQLDGSIWNPKNRKYQNYATSIALTTLYLSQNKDYEAACRKARKFLKNSQFKKTSDTEQDRLNEGGIGYGSNPSLADLSNTQLALEALYISSPLDMDADVSAEERAATKKCWQKAEQFLSKCQKISSNTEAWVKANTFDKDNGGAIYSPGTSKVNGSVLRTYGSMTYALFKSFIYAKVALKDKRIKEINNWISNNYTLDSNPGMNLQGYFYYLHTMAKALHATKKDTIMHGTNKINWREDLTKKFFELQKDDGSWINSEGRWRENNPILVTSYSLISLAFTTNHKDAY